MRLLDLMNGNTTEVTNETALLEVDITGLTCDSRKVNPGFLFAALAGSETDGSRFIDDAIDRGAAAVLAAPGSRNFTVPLIADDNPRHRFAMLAARFYENQPETVAAVTGTNGKTSVVSFVRQIWTGLGLKAASLGTLGLGADGFDAGQGLTTPDPSDLHRTLAELAGAGIDHLAMEASSHGLEQCRLDGVRIELAAFTNLSRDHLDYHGSMEDYLAAKQRLFSQLLEVGGVAVINAADETAAGLGQIAGERGCTVIEYGRGAAHIRLDEIEPMATGQHLKLTVMGKPMEVTLPLVGEFQAENALCALGLVIAGGGQPENAVRALENLIGIAGRLEHVTNNTYVDYAHTPDALAHALAALRPHTENNLTVVFGCGGDRDTGKRPEMGRIASELADHVFVTDDNPRFEDAAGIRSQIMTACPRATEIGARGKAIAAAIGRHRPGDVLLVAGKGHETGQIVGDEVHPFNDADEIRRAWVQVGAMNDE